MTVLLTRPQGRNRALESALSAQGRTFHTTPLLALIANPTPPTRQCLQDADLIIFVSANAVRFAHDCWGESQYWPTQGRYFGVGQATINALQAIGLKAMQPAADNQQSEGLLQLPELTQVQDKQVLIVRGNGGRELLSQTLTERGASVHYAEVYRRICPPYDGKQLVQQWQQAGVDTILITSPAMLENLIQLIPKDLFSYIANCHIIVPSHRAKTLAVAQGFCHVTNANGADAQAMLSALK